MLRAAGVGRCTGRLLYSAAVRPSRDLPLRRSCHVLTSTAALLVSVGFLVVRLPPDVYGFRLVLARSWHDPACSPGLRRSAKIGGRCDQRWWSVNRQSQKRVSITARYVKISSVTENKSPEWAAPCNRFMRYMFQVIDLLDLTRIGTNILTMMPRAASVLLAGTELPEEQKATYERQQKEAEKMARLAESEIANDFPLLHSHALMGAWGALEGMIEDLTISWMQHNPSVLDEPKLARIRVPLIEFQQMGDQDRLRFLVTQLQGDLGLELKSGATKFESLLAVFGLGGPVDERVRDVIFETQNLRNVFAHRGGVADRKFVTNCPHLQYNIGDAVKIGVQDFGRILFGLLTYGAIILNRCRAIEEMSPFAEDFPGFEGALSVFDKGNNT